MDCFFAAVEMREDPALVRVPLAIGGSTARRGVISTCNYVARQFGVHSAMPTAQALRLCPRLVLLPGRMELYQQVSKALRHILLRYSDCIEPLSLDEAYLDVSDSSWYYGSATRIAEAIRRDIREELQLTASAGVAPNKFLAKIASDINKPDGLFVLAPEQVAEFVSRLPLRKIPGIGEKTAQRLALCGLHCGADVQAYPAHELLRQFGKTGEMLLERVQGRDNRPVNSQRIRQSVGVEVTLPEDLTAEAQIWPIMAELELELIKRLHRHVPDGRISRQGVKLKFADFQQTTVEKTCAQLTSPLFIELFHRAWARGQGRGIRLVGLSVGLPSSHTDTAKAQMDLPFLAEPTDYL